MAKTVICPHCNAENSSEVSYCYFCGGQLPRASFAKRVILPVLKGLGFFGFYYVVQSLVTTFYSLIAMLTDPSVFNIPYGDFSEAFESTMNKMLEALSRFMPDIGIVSAILTLVGYFIFFKIRKKSFFKEIKVRPIRPGVAGAMFSFGLCALFAVSIGLSLLYSVFPGLSNYSNSEELDQLINGGNPVMQFINISIVTGIIEETIFRGLIYTTLRKTVSVPGAVILSAVIFGIAHMNIEQFFYTSMLGVLMALVYEKYKTIFAPIIVHATFNGSNYILGALSFEGDMPYIAIMILAVAVFIITVALVFFSERIPLSKIKKEL